MALKLMKLALEANTVVRVNPKATKYFYVSSTETAAGTALTIDAAQFFDNAGNAVTELVNTDTNSYVNVYVNGVLQMDGISTYTAGATGVGSCVINVPAGGDPILAGTPVIVEVVTIDSDNTTTTIES